MSSLRSFVFGCVSDRGPEPTLPRNTKRLPNAPFERQRSTRLKFGVTLVDALKDDSLPDPLVEILVYLAREGVTTTDLFRRPGNATDLKIIMKRLSEGREIQLNNYNFYTLASVVKKFLLKIPGGVFGPDVEYQLLQVLLIDNRMQQHNAIHSIISSLSPAVQKLMSLLFGTWFRIVNHSEFNTMSSESVAKSVAGSLFHTCAEDPVKVDHAVHILQILIDDFGVGKMFGRKNIQYFTETTRTGINVREKYQYELSVPAEKSMTELADYMPLFVRIVDHDIICHGLDPAIHAITEDEFYSLSHPVTSSKPSSPESSTVEADLRPSASSPPSPRSLQPNVTYAETDPNYNPHKKLTHVSSLSAPEVNQVCLSPSNAMSPSSPCPGLSTSLSRFDSVRRRQLMRLRKRSNWFLSPNISHDSRSALSSFEASGGGISSMDPASSEATTSDGTMSDCIPASDGIRISSDLDCPFDESTTLFRSTDPVLRRLQQKPRCPTEEESKEAGTGCEQLLPSLLDVPMPSRALETDRAAMLHTLHPQEDQELRDGRTRYFVVENYYGSAADNLMQS